ncbi:MAG: hypothetical protein JSW03_07105 [Candidatus Eiseniibacteriota bacterium]|nr:MAG: hypothetical protein JSW03_07105 [Candidatus Eisenbacteria bacterium]
MRHFAKATGLLLPLLVGLFLMTGVVFAAPPEATVTAYLTYLSGPPGNKTYLFEYTIENISLTPSISGFVIHFDDDGLDRSDFVSYEYPEGWDDVFVTPEAPDGSWAVEWNELFGTNRILPGETKNGFSVTFIWNDPEATPGPQEFEVWNGGAYVGETEVIPTNPTATELTSWGAIKCLFR